MSSFDLEVTLAQPRGFCAGVDRAIEIVDVQGSRSRFDFDGIRENLGLADKLFRFEVPRGVEVIAG